MRPSEKSDLKRICRCETDFLLLLICKWIFQGRNPKKAWWEQDSKTNPPANDLTEDPQQRFDQLRHLPKDDIEEIFGDGSYNPENEQILRTIGNSIVPGECVAKASSVIKSKTTQDAPAGTGKKRKRYKLTPVSCDLRQSLWPCELHMQKQRRRDILGPLAELDIRQHEIVRFRFEQLLGEDREDEFAPYSPSLKLNEILMSSCMKRIAPVIVKCLMHPLKEGLIANRYIFKKLAKKLAHNIVLIDQYADEEFIKERIDEFFCAGHRIENLMDIERI